MRLVTVVSVVYCSLNLFSSRTSDFGNIVTCFEEREERRCTQMTFWISAGLDEKHLAFGVVSRVPDEKDDDRRETKGARRNCN